MPLSEVKIASTKNTPEITLNPDGTIKIYGRSMGSISSEIFKMTEEWIEEYISDPADTTCVDVCLEYLNSSDFKFYITVLKKISSVISKDIKLIINWYYEEGDEDILEKGEYVSMFLDVPVNFVKMSEHFNHQMIEEKSDD